MDGYRRPELPGAKQVAAGRTNESGYDAYQRSFSYSAPSGSNLVIYVRSEVLLGSTTEQAGSDFAGATGILRTKASQKAIAASLATSLKVPAKAVKVGKPKSPKVGDRAFEVPMTVTSKSLRLYSTLLYVLLDRAIVMHSAAYATPSFVATHGVLGRSNGCFAMAPEDFPSALTQLSGGRLLFADKLSLA